MWILGQRKRTRLKDRNAKRTTSPSRPDKSKQRASGRRKRISFERSLVLQRVLRWRPRTKVDYILLGTAALVVVLASVGVYKAIDKLVRWSRLPRYANRAERDFRRERFPSVEDRVRIYMSNWYMPPCNSDGQVVYERVLNTTADEQSGGWFYRGASEYDRYYYKIRELESSISGETRRTLVLTNKPKIGRMFYLDEDDLYHCYLQREWSIRHYCSDSIASIVHTAMPNAGFEDKDPLPVLCQFSDETESMAQDANDLLSWQSNPRIPHIKKLRFALPPKEIDRLTNSAADCHTGPRDPPRGMTQMQPILWLLNVDRHFKYSRDVPRYDMPWEKKADAAVFRGLLTGLEYNKDASDEENCENLIRCKLVYETAESRIVDAKLSSTFNKMPEMFHGVNLTGEELRKEELLAFKGLIVLEGNDVSSGLKWAMVSKSVVLMPAPRFTSWSMEEILEPWVHYIPITRDLKDVEEKVRWMLDHQAEAQRISHRATLFVLDLYYHPDAMEDNREINAEILRRYRAHFRQRSVIS